MSSSRSIICLKSDAARFKVEGNRIELLTYRGVIHDPRRGAEAAAGGGRRAQRRSDFLYKKPVEQVLFFALRAALLAVLPQ